MLEEYINNLKANEINGYTYLWIVTILLIGIVSYHIIFRVLRRWVSSLESRLRRIFNKHIYKAGFVAFVSISLWPTMGILEDKILPILFNPLKKIVILFIIASCSYLLIKVIEFLRDFFLIHFEDSHTSDLRIRKIRTQLRILGRIANFIIIVTAVALGLMTFDSIRHLGSTILASAGVIGVILGFAAQKSIATIIAGIQIAISQPIRIDDVVIVEGEWGRIEEITLTYVVVNIWDKRRLILPINYFIEKPFQNWTRSSTDLIGVVLLYLDYSVPLDKIRAYFPEILKESSLWDGNISNVQVTDANDKTMVVRLTASSYDSSKAFDLRCEIREKMIVFLQQNYPHALPRFRFEANTSSFN